VTIGSFILKNALGNRRRATLTILSVAASLFLLVTVLVALREITLPAESLGASLRLVVHNKTAIAHFLPVRQRAVIERIPGVEAVTPFTWFGGKYKNDESATFAQFGIDPKVMRQVFVEAHMTDREAHDFETVKDSCVLGKITADKYHLKVGDRLALESADYRCTLTFRLVGIYSGTADDRNLFFHQDYLDGARGNPGTVSMWYVKVKKAADMPGVIAKIEGAFANTSAEVKAQGERAFQLSFLSRWGNVKALVTWICSAVVFTMALVTASTMSMAVRERFRELAVLKALGFRWRELLLCILAESCGLSLAGAVLGIGAACLLFNFANISELSHGIFVRFQMTPRIIGLALLVAGSLGVVAGIGPGVEVARTSVVAGLKRLD
jgi:putative ABC transport system permease protein